MTNKQTVYCVSFPKSGSTWLTRLLGQVLDCPTGGSMPSEDVSEIATEGLKRPGPYVVRKGHFRLDEADYGPLVPYPHVMAYKQIVDEKIVFIYRDPRDICISGAWHWRVSPDEFLNRMIRGEVAKCGRWDEYVMGWLGKFDINDGNGFAKTSYEELLNNTLNEVKWIIFYLGLPELSWQSIQKAIDKQSFSSRVKQVGGDASLLRKNNLHVAEVGQWRKYFTPQMTKLIWREFGQTMEKLGYTK